MGSLVPWQARISKSKPYYYKNTRGRPARGIEVMLRICLLQIWFNLSDEGLEEVIYNSVAMKDCMRFDFFVQTVSDVTVLLKFRRIIENNHLGKKMFHRINSILEKDGKLMHGGRIVDATIIEVPVSTKNTKYKRDAQMHQTKKVNEWAFRHESGYWGGRLYRFCLTW